MVLNILKVRCELVRFGSVILGASDFVDLRILFVISQLASGLLNLISNLK